MRIFILFIIGGVLKIKQSRVIFVCVDVDRQKRASKRQRFVCKSLLTSDNARHTKKHTLAEMLV